MKVLATTLAATLLLGGQAGWRGTATPAPAFPSYRPADWIGAPVTWDDLRGKVVLLDVWTFG